jgi:5-carboxyvanillate decarboxylase
MERLVLKHFLLTSSKWNRKRRDDMRQSKSQPLKSAMTEGVAGQSEGHLPTDIPAVNKNYKRIAIEESFATIEVNKAIGSFMGSSESEIAGHRSIAKYYSEYINGWGPLLLDIGEGRIAAMDAVGIQKMILSLTSNGVQSLNADLATGLVKDANDQLHDSVVKYPDRFDGLVAIAPQTPETAARELERGITQLGMKGVIINSHAAGEFLDVPKYRVIFEAAQAVNAPIYLHPSVPPPSINQPYLDYGLIGAMMGFAAETSLHAMRLILSGLFDDFPKLRMVLGHLGEGIPYFFQRIDTHFMYVRPRMSKKPKRLPSEYFKDHFWVSTSGMNGTPAVKFCKEVLGFNRIMFAADYPFEPMPLEVKRMDDETFSEDEMNEIYHANAEKLFRL